MTRQRIRRSQWQKMITTDGIIAQVNSLSEDIRLREDEIAEDAKHSEQAKELERQEQERAAIVRIEEEQPGEGPHQGVPLGAAEVAGENETKDQCPELVAQEEDDDSDEEDEEDEEEIPLRRSERIKHGTVKPARYAATTVKLREGGHNAEEKNARINEAKRAEIKQVFEELKALQPVEKGEIPEGIKPLGCHLFTVEKFDASGQHEKYKSRLVSHGNEQDQSLYPDRSSPTVSVHAILTCLALAACNTGYTLGKIDVKGAFIQTEMSGTPVYIKCTRQLRDLIVDLYPEYEKYIGRDGVLYCKLLKALYGCVQASKLWYQKVSKFLESLGYERGEVDPCVFRRVVGEKVYLLTLYVDDILLIAESSEIERVGKAFEAGRYGVNGRKGVCRSGHEILSHKSLRAIRQSADQGGPRKQGDFFGQERSGGAGPQEKDAIPLYGGKAPLFIQESATGHHCGSWIPVHKGEGSDSRRLGEIGKSPRVSEGDEGFRHEA